MQQGGIINANFKLQEVQNYAIFKQHNLDNIKSFINKFWNVLFPINKDLYRWPNLKLTSWINYKQNLAISLALPHYPMNRNPCHSSSVMNYGSELTQIRIP